MTREELILANRGLVYEVVFRLARFIPQVKKEQEEMVSVGLLALVRAADSWPQHRYQFGVWAALQIRSRVVKYANRYATVISGPSWRKPKELPTTVPLESWQDLVEHQEPEPLDLTQMLRVLTADQLRCVVLRFGLGGGPEMSRHEIVAATNMTPGRVAKLLGEAYALLRKNGNCCE